MAKNDSGTGKVPGEWTLNIRERSVQSDWKVRERYDRKKSERGRNWTEGEKDNLRETNLFFFLKQKNV